MPLDYKFKPLVLFPRPFTRARGVAKFTSTATGKRTSFGVTMDDLAREIRFLNGRNVTIQVALKDDDIRLDGQIRSTARLPEHPGVILAFDGKHGAMSFVQDKYTHWHDNLRSIALTLQALRTVDRYGVTEHGEQYQGFKALPSAEPPKPTGTKHDAAKVIVFYSCLPGNTGDLLTDPVLAKQHYIEAVKRTHPDTGGSSDASRSVSEAWNVLQGIK